MENKLNYLVDLANELDNNQAHRLADTITHQIKTASEDYDHEFDMVRNQMETAERAIDGIEDVIGEDGEGNLMAWVQSKITNAVEMLDGVSDYLQSQHKTASDKNKGKKLNKPFRTPGGPKKFSVYVKNDKGNIIEASNANLFIVSNGVLYTPTLNSMPVFSPRSLKILRYPAT